MFAGVSGLRNHQVKMDVIGNNIANVNTQGFKASRTSFKEMYSQTMQAPSGPTDSLGGTNPMQVGLGVTTASIDVLFGTGSTQTTGRALDIAIEGEGFLAVTQGDLTYYTRSGNLYLDANGFLITAGGLYVRGLNFLDISDPDIFGDDFDEFEGVTDPVDVDEFLEMTGQELAQFIEDESGRLIIPKTFTNISIGKDGRISGINQNGDLMDIGMIPLVMFVNAPGLDRVGDNLYLESTNSGDPLYRRAAGNDGAGNIKSGALEMSNVDLSKEFTEMIITQRGFQANSRIITVSDTLLEELVNLKR
jgi:flagellar hook protein FlgE